MEEPCVNTRAKITAAGRWEPKGFVVEPQQTQGRAINFAPHCGVQVSHAREGHSVREAQSVYGGGTTEGGSSRRTRPIIIADTATTQAINKHFLLRKASQRCLSAAYCVTSLSQLQLPTRTAQVPPAKPGSTARC